MLNLFDHEMKQLKENLKKHKVESFEELFQTFTENQRLKQELIVLKEIRENEIKRIKADNEINLSKQQAKHEQEMTSLKHTIRLEKERIESDTKQKIAEVQHKLNLERLEFEKEKETLILQLKQEVQEERKKFLEANYSDLKNDANNSLDRSLKAIGMFLEKVNFTSSQKLITGNVKEDETTVNLNHN